MEGENGLETLVLFQQLHNPEDSNLEIEIFSFRFPRTAAAKSNYMFYQICRTTQLVDRLE